MRYERNNYGVSVSDDTDLVEKAQKEAEAGDNCVSVRESDIGKLIEVF